jgi:hypothetical protein
MERNKINIFKNMMNENEEIEGMKEDLNQLNAKNKGSAFGKGISIFGAKLKGIIEEGNYISNTELVVKEDPANKPVRPPKLFSFLRPKKKSALKETEKVVSNN